MIGNRDFELQLDAWLDQDSAHRVPDHLADVLLRTSVTRQRRWWPSPRGWRPLNLRLQPAPGAPLWRAMGVLALVALLIAAALVAYVASGQPSPPPPPFGLGHNGELLMNIDADLYAVDPTTGDRRALIVGSTFEHGAAFSPEGRRLGFIQQDEPGVTRLMVGNADGTGIRPVYVLGMQTPVYVLGWAWSPDGTRIAVLEGPGGPARLSGLDALKIIDLESGRTSAIAVPPNVRLGGAAFGFRVAWRAGRDELLVTGDTIDPGGPPAVFGVGLDGSVRVVVRAEHEFVELSPDGELLSYFVYQSLNALVGSAQVHLVDVDTGDDRVFTTGRASWEEELHFSPDRRTGVMIVCSRPFDDCELVVVSLDESMPPRTVGTISGPTPKERSIVFAPDGASIAVSENDRPGALVDLATGEAKVLPEGQVQAWRPLP